MDGKGYNIKDVLAYLEPSELDYTEWTKVGMGLKESGYSVEIWDDWSARDPGRYHPGECEKKWNSFRGGYDRDVSVGSIVQMAKDRGWMPPVEEGHELSWDDYIGKDKKVIDKAWLEGEEVHEPNDKEWKQAAELIKYIDTLFASDEYVGYVCEAWQNKDGKYLPSKGVYTMTAGELIDKLSKCKNNDIGSVLGDYKPEVGAWIRFNPLDGKGVKNDNVTDFRYALVESDTMPIDKQNAMIRELELPVACLVYSGGKSVHAIVKIDAADYAEYRKRVDYLYEVCKQNGLVIDTQNRNPSRLSRMPGVRRGEHKQFLIDTNIGKETWNEWKEWIESVNDDLPDLEPLSDVWDDLPPLAPPLIDGILRQGHKMLVAGPTKAGKSFLLIEMAIAIASGTPWLAWNCARGKVLYINLELDRASCLHRFHDVYEKRGIDPESIRNIDIWNLRGKSCPMDKLAPKLIRRAAKKDYIAIIVDPIYKIITGDENSASEMAFFCNQFDKICTELGCAVIYCHHHSKGSQSQKKSMDRASGSGVFARDPDALLDIIELKMDEKHLFEAKTALGLDDDALDALSAWRIDGTLREFPKFKAINAFFDWPEHIADRWSILDEVSEVGSYWKEKTSEQNKERRKNQRFEDLDKAFEAAGFSGPPTIKMMAEYLGKTEKTIRRWISESPNYEIVNSNVHMVEGKQMKFPSE